MNKQILNVIGEQKLQLTGITGKGRNNVIYQAKNIENGILEAVKIYRGIEIGDDRDRQTLESRCLYYAKECGYENAPRIIDVCKENRITRMSWINGKHPKELREEHVHEIKKFLIKCRPSKTKSQKVQAASDSLKSVEKKVTELKNRYERTINYCNSIEAKELSEWIQSELSERIDKESRKLLECTNRRHWEKKYYEEVFSQSDVGIHNMLERKGNIYLIDFEYGGIDDLAKLAIDLILQPRHKDKRITNAKIIEILAETSKANYWIERTRDLEEISILKWCLIIIGKPRNTDEAKERLGKAKDYLYNKNSEMGGI